MSDTLLWSQSELVILLHLHLARHFPVSSANCRNLITTHHNSSQLITTYHIPTHHSSTSHTSLITAPLLITTHHSSTSDRSTSHHFSQVHFSSQLITTYHIPTHHSSTSHTSLLTPHLSHHNFSSQLITTYHIPTHHSSTSHTTSHTSLNTSEFITAPLLTPDITSPLPTPHFSHLPEVHIKLRYIKAFHCSCTILKSRGQRYPCHFLCQRSWVTCGKDIDQGRLIYVPAIVPTVDFLFLFMSCALFLRS